MVSSGSNKIGYSKTALTLLSFCFVMPSAGCSLWSLPKLDLEQYRDERVSSINDNLSRKIPETEQLIKASTKSGSKNQTKKTAPETEPKKI